MNLLLILAIWTAPTCEPVDVAVAVNSAANGDTVLLPPGVCRHGITLPISKSITLQGNSTVIVDAMVGTGVLVNVTLQPNGFFRMTGIEFRDGGMRTPNANGVINVSNQTGGGPLDSRRFRIDHCIFVGLNATDIRSKAYGVIDHNEFQLKAGTYFGIYAFTAADFDFSDARWAEPSNFGGEQFLFVEDNIFTRAGIRPYALIDANGGARYVIRHNQITGSWIEAHGTDSPGRTRGTRAVEIYQNIFTPIGTSENILANIRSGGLLVWGNRAAGGYTMATNAARLVYEPGAANFNPFGGSGGDNPWDLNDPGNPIAAYTSTGAGSLSITVSGAAWVPNMWAGYTILKRDCDETDAVTCHGLVISNTGSILSFSANGGGSQVSLQFKAAGGEGFELNRILAAHDAPCRGQGSLLSARPVSGVPNMQYSTATGRVTATLKNHGFHTGDTVAMSDSVFMQTQGVKPVRPYQGTFAVTVLDRDTFTFVPRVSPVGNSTLSPGYATRLPAGWNDQVTEPCYQWDNTRGGIPMTFGVFPYGGIIRKDEHYFDGPMPGYVPFTYPHPLTLR